MKPLVVLFCLFVCIYAAEEGPPTKVAEPLKPADEVDKTKEKNADDNQTGKKKKRKRVVCENIAPGKQYCQGFGALFILPGLILAFGARFSISGLVLAFGALF